MKEKIRDKATDMFLNFGFKSVTMDDIANAMGISKAMAEKLMVAKSRTIPEGGTVVCATRYGNVMASRGSVIPLFIQQLLDDQEITVTDPSMTRFLMSLEESVDLVLHAFEHGQQGDIFIQKAPASTVADLAQALKELLNKTNPVKVIGTRHGEKLYESLVSREEMAKAEDMGRYFRIPADNRDLNYKKYFVEGEQRISEFDDYTSHNTHRLDVQGVKEVLSTLDYVRGFLNAQGHDSGWHTTRTHQDESRNCRTRQTH